MNNKLRGIALILMGCLLALVDIASQLYNRSTATMVMAFIGLVIGVTGLVLAFIKENK